MSSQRYSLGVATVMAACFISLTAQANSAGIGQRSGKQGQGCTTGCHASGASPTAPTVVLQGPTTLAAGATGNYSLVITGGPAVKAGMNVAVSNGGGTLTPGAGLKAAPGAADELTHSAPKDFANNEARFDFTLVAPATAGTVTLYGSGNSTNGNAAITGDNAASVMVNIQVTAPSAPDAGTPDAGNPGGGGGDGDGDDDGGGCSAAGGAPMVLLLGLVAAYLRRRRD